MAEKMFVVTFALNPKAAEFGSRQWDGWLAPYKGAASDIEKACRDVGMLFQNFPDKASKVQRCELYLRGIVKKPRLIIQYYSSGTLTIINPPAVWEAGHQLVIIKKGD